MIFVWATLLLTSCSSNAFSFSSIILSKERVRDGSILQAEKVDSFDGLQSLENRLGVLETGASEMLRSFYEPELKSFSIQPGGVNRISITSSCSALQSIISSEDATVYDSFISKKKTDSNDKRASIPEILLELVNAPWREDDLFQVPILLYTILKVDSDRSLLRNELKSSDIASKIRSLLDATISARPKRRDGTDQIYSDYIMFQCCQVYSDMQDMTEIPSPSDIEPTDDQLNVGNLPVDALPEGAASQIPLALSRCAELSFNEMCRQLAYQAAGDNSTFDAIRLAYALLIYVKATRSLAGTAGRELVPGQGPSPGTRTPPINKRLVSKALAAFFEEQSVDGLWDKGQPIYKAFRRKGRNVGNAFVFAVETVGSLLQTLDAEDFRPHLGALNNILEWIESHQAVEVIPDYCDKETGQCYGRSLRGWASPHLSPGTSPQAWSTAHVLTYISLMRSTVRELLNDDVLLEFNGISYSGQGIKTRAWDRLLDSDLGNPERDGTRTLKSVLEERFIVPFESSVSSPGLGAAYSAILFGPPGTAKTTICESLAQRMGWDFVVIDTASFLADGLSNVAARIRYVFDRLQRLNQCVILFDEIEEFCLDRESPGLGMESRMLTTAMLTAINDLRKKKQSIFFLATNRLRAFDAAIIRPGRIDIQLFVGTPNLESRVIQFKSKLGNVGASEERKEKAIDNYRKFLESVWTKDAMFMNYLEGVQFATLCAGLVASGSEMTEEEMHRILEQQAAVMTVRGAVRDEYAVSMDMSRL
mmetsp:Transcript_25338/g.28923  ORF Transcript_25338/g.28923 Transcript_25338/m.28923 type:complete len:763 (-) Transcript_25338:224-2512(-)|eukprot:CAMPEP_0194130226 /NCGR_PEP_ID=MMETSP0152-20130528/1307_1 /TAXON_ID=1049557 /ORGANISM="Thalassiothrix antarctica, Strain L6-D1" /LENGTH=762 /DNA_ID=CAMNT_0038824665 /DNA_START=91 /DNA_END=2379 /DNA_ORIENTATION=+